MSNELSIDIDVVPSGNPSLRKIVASPIDYVSNATDGCFPDRNDMKTAIGRSCWLSLTTVMLHQ